MTTTHSYPGKNNLAAMYKAASWCAFAIALVFTAMAVPNLADAQVPSASLPLATTPLLSVKPLLGVVGEPRTLSVTGQWPDTCPPVAATLDDSLAKAGKTIFVRLLLLPTSVKCPAGITPYRFEIPYAAREVGVLEVLIFGSVLTINNGKGEITTAAPAGTAALARSAGNISGAWYDPVTSGSGLSFVHAYQGSDAVFGTWYLYDRNGLPRWLSIQDVTWSEGGTVMEGKLFETRAGGSDICPQNVIACPATSTSLEKIGRIRATFVGIDLYNDVSPQAKIEAFSNTNTLLFSSNIIRAF